MTADGFGGIKRACFALSAAAFLFATSAAVPDSKPTIAAERTPVASTILLIDANGDMGADAGAAKFDLQRQALAAAPLPTEAKITLAAYGGRGCSKFGLVDGEDGVAKALAGVEPAGRRNLVAALNGARDAFPADAERKRVLAIVGGPNQCLAALCAYADRMKAETPELVVDVIGFGLTDEAAVRLDCLAANTGGRFTRADENGLATALTLALGPRSEGLDGVTPPAAPAAAQTPPAPAPETSSADYALTGPEMFFPRGLRLSATLSAVDAPLGVGARYELYRREADGGLSLVARTERTATPLFSVPPGAYLARVTLGAAMRQVDVAVPEVGVANRRVALNAGQVELAAMVSGRPAAHDAGFVIERLDRATPAIQMNRSGQVLATLPEGRYRVTARVGQARQAREIQVTAGGLGRAVLDVPIGFLRVAAPGRVDGLRIYRDGREVARARAGETLFRLPPGAYQVVGRSEKGPVSAQALIEDGRMALARLVGRPSLPPSTSMTPAGSSKPHAGRMTPEAPPLQGVALRRAY